MTAPKRLTRKLFWGHWMEVAPGFAIDKYGFMRGSGGHCPLTAVAEQLGMPVEWPANLRTILPDEWPGWALDVVDAADGNTELATYRRLVEHIPEGNR